MSTLELPLLKALNHASAHLLTERDPHKGLSHALALIGMASGVDRVYIFENSRLPEAGIALSQRFEWVRDSISVQVDNPVLQNLPYVASGYGRWYEEMSQKRPIKGLVQDFPASEHPLLAEQDILSILCLPIFIEDHFWGFVGFDDCTRERIWDIKEEQVLLNLANTLGGFFMRQQYEESLLEVQGQLEEAQRIAKVGNWRYDKVNASLSVSEEIYRIFGTPHDYSFMGEALKQHFDSQTFAALSSTVGTCLENRQKVDRILPARRLDQQQIYIRLIAEPLFDAQGNPNQLQGVLMDVTQEMLLQQDLIEAKNQAEKASQAKSEFLSTMSHEIRTPLNAVIGYAHLLLAENPRPDQQEYLETLRFSSENLLALINDILDYSKIEAGKVELEQTSFSLKTLLSGIVQGQLPRADENGVSVRYVFPEDVPEEIISDPVRLGQILTNLTSNAVKFTHDGKVNLRVSLESKQDQALSLQFEVTDTGIGIAPEQQSHIFDQFTQAQTSTTRHYGGTGLGLAITKKLLNLFSTEIQVESEVGKGSRFYFTLQVKAAPAHVGISSQGGHAKGKALSGEGGLAGLNVLVVEDNLVNLKVLKRFLKKWGIQQVGEAHNGQEGVQQAIEGSFDLILMDLHMPVMNGYDATAAIREAGIEVPVIALTAETMPEVYDRIREVGMDDYAAKPFNPNSLFQKLRQHAPRPGLMRN